MGHTPLRIGVGIASGRVFSGHIGSAQKRQLTVLGDPVNTAARLQEETKHQNVPIIIGAQIADKVRARFRLRALGEVSLRGKSHSLPVWAGTA